MAGTFATGPIVKSLTQAVKILSCQDCEGGSEADLKERLLSGGLKGVYRPLNTFKVKFFKTPDTPIDTIEMTYEESVWRVPSKLNKFRTGLQCKGSPKRHLSCCWDWMTRCQFSEISGLLTLHPYRWYLGMQFTMNIALQLSLSILQEHLGHASSRISRVSTADAPNFAHEEIKGNHNIAKPAGNVHTYKGYWNLSTPLDRYVLTANDSSWVRTNSAERRYRGHLFCNKKGGKGSTACLSGHTGRQQLILTGLS